MVKVNFDKLLYKFKMYFMAARYQAVRVYYVYVYIYTLSAIFPAKD